MGMLERQDQAGQSDSEQRLGFRTILFTDMVGSSRLKQLLGDRQAVPLIQEHHRLVRDTLRQFDNGAEIETAGDSFLILFTQAPDAVAFALVLQNRLRAFSQQHQRAILDRIGIHAGDIYIRESEGRAQVFGMHVDMAARVMALAEGGQVLVSKPVFDSARQALNAADLASISELTWLNHGPYALKGFEDPMEICEIGEKGLAPEKPPAATPLAERQVVSEEQSLFGWRPAVGQRVPGTEWVLNERLGEGGFGEVWLGGRANDEERRVFKFCFRLDRIRALKREVTLFRLLVQRIGQHPRIVRLLQVCFEQPPVYLVEEYVPGKDLKSWCDRQGGPSALPLETKIEIIAQAAEGLQAAHDAGVIHRDIKPGNILVSAGSVVAVKLSDFGIGQLVAGADAGGVTEAGFTMTVISPHSSQTGTQVYMAPELQSGQPVSIRSDIYSLGVVLYQLLIGDFSRPLTTDWEKGISEPLLREDLRRCFAGEPSDRFEGAGQLAKNLRSLEQRRSVLAEQERKAAAREKAAYRRGVLRTTAIAAAIVAVIAGLGLMAYRNGQQSRERLVRLNLSTGIRLFETEDWLGSLSWLAEALSLDNNPSRVETGRLRIGAVLHQAPKLCQLWAHRDMVTSADFGPNNRIVTACRDGTVQVWDSVTGQPVLRPLRLEQPVLSVAFSRDGRHLLTTTGDDAVQWWDAANGARVGSAVHHVPGERDQTVAAAFSPDSRRIVTCGGDRLLRLFDADSGRELMNPIRHDSMLEDVAFSPKGDRLVVCGTGGQAWIRDSHTGAALCPPLRHADKIIAGRFNAEGTRVVTCSRDATAQVWDAVTGAPIGAPMRHGRSLLTAQFSPDGRYVATSSYDRTARVWDATTGLPTLHPLRHMHSVVQATFSPDGRFILTSSHDQTARVWDASNGEPVFEFKHNGFVLFSGFAPNGHQVLTASQDRSAKLWDISGSLEEHPTIHYGQGPINWITSSPDSKLIAAASADGSAAVFNPFTGKLVMQVRHQTPISTVAFSPQGDRLLTASQDRTAQIWLIPSGAPVGEPLRHDGPVTCACFDSAGKRVLTGSDDGTARIWNATSMTLTAPVLRHDGKVKWVAFSPDGTKVATASSDRTARLWDANTGQPLGPPLPHDVEVRHVAFSPDGRKLVTACADAYDPYVFPARSGQMWDVATSKPLGPPLHHADGVLWAGFSPDGRLVVTTSEDGTARLWDAGTGKATGLPMKHQWHVNYAEFSTDGNMLLTAGRDGTARLWDVHSGDPILPVLRHNSQNVRASLSPDGAYVATGSDQGAIHIFDIPKERRPVGELRRLAELLTGGTLDPLLGVTPLGLTNLIERWRTLRDTSAPDFIVLPQTLEMWDLHQAELCSRQRLWQGALLHLATLVAAEPNNPDYRLKRAEIYCAHSQWPNAEADLVKVTERRPKDLRAYELLAQTYQEQNKADDAIRAYSTAIELMEPEPEMRSRRKRAYAGRSALFRQQHRLAEAALDRLRSLDIPLRNPSAPPNLIDLSAFYNFSFADDLHGIAGNNLLPLPVGAQVLSGIPFDLRGIVQLANRGLLTQSCPSECLGIPVGQKCRIVHFLHGAAWGGSVPSGTIIGRYVLHFADGSSQTVPIRIGADLLDWWQPPGPATAAGGPVVAWAGRNHASPIRLFRSDWTNPVPQVAVSAIDFVSNMTPTAIFLVALTTE